MNTMKVIHGDDSKKAYYVITCPATRAPVRTWILNGLLRY